MDSRAGITFARLEPHAGHVGSMGRAPSLSRRIGRHVAEGAVVPLEPGRAADSLPDDLTLVRELPFLTLPEQLLLGLLFGGGALAVVLHRASSRFRGAGTLTSVGASFASALPFLHGENPFTWLFYLLPGPVMDLAFRYLPLYANKLWFLVLLGGFAHATKPVGQLIMNLLSGWPFGSFRYGVVYPFASHLLFGMIGGLVGALIVLGNPRASSKSSD